MATIKYGFMKRATDVAEALQIAQNGDTVQLGSSLKATNVVTGGNNNPKKTLFPTLQVANKKIYIEGKENGGTSLYVGEHSIGINIKNADVYIKNVNFSIMGLANGIMAQNSRVHLENCTFEYVPNRKIPERDYYPHLFLKDGDFVELDHVSGRNIRMSNMNTVKITNTNTDGLHVINYESLMIDNSVMVNTTLSGQYGEINNSVMGVTSIFGNNLLQNVTLDDTASEKYMLFVPEGKNATLKPTLVLDHVKVHERVVQNDNALLRVQTGKLVIQNSNFPATKQSSLLNDAVSVELTNVHDKSLWDNQGAGVKHDRESESALIVKSIIDPNTSAMAKLNNLIGLDKAKEVLKRFIDTAGVNEEMRKRGIASNNSFSLHMIFGGHAGTGKTTVARLVGQALFENGVLPENKFVETSAKDLVAGYVGQTASKTHEVIQKAIGGVLFIDEMYGLNSNAGQNSFNSEAINQLIADMENNRGNLVVIGAGYTDDMRSLMNSNEGLTSRFTNWVEFDDYSDDDLVQMGLMMLGQQKAILDVSLKDNFGRALVNYYHAQGDNGNGRTVRNFVERVIMNRNSRNASEIANLTNEQLLTVIEQDYNFSY